MVSILGDKNYTFPKELELKYKLKDLLENEVDQKYYLSAEMKKYLYSFNDKYIVNVNNLVVNRDIACTKTTREGNTRADSSDYISNKLKDNFGYDDYLKIKNATKKGYLEAVAGDSVDLAYPNSKMRRGRVQKGMIQTLTTSDNLGVVMNDLNIRKLTPTECFRLMGVKDSDSNKLDQSNSSKYHLAGDSIVTTVLMAVFGQLLGIDYQQAIEHLLQELII